MKTLIVSAKDGDFKTLNEAAEALKGGNEETLLKIVPGEYRESVVFECSNLTIEGDSSDLIYICDGNHAKKKYPDGREMGTFRSPVLRINGDNNTIKNLTIENNAGIGFRIGPAIALYSEGDGFRAENCKLIAHQDTLFTAPLPENDRPSKQYFKNCYIEGDIDFIFGGATALFENCTLFTHDVVAEYRLQKMIDCSDNDWDAMQSTALRGFSCAPSTAEGLDYGYLFLNCQFTSNCPRETVFLGRPWRPYGRAFFVNCTIGNHIKQELFSDWDNEKNRETCLFAIAGCKRPDGTMIEDSGEIGFATIIGPEEADAYVSDFKSFISA